MVQSIWLVQSSFSVEEKEIWVSQTNTEGERKSVQSRLPSTLHLSESSATTTCARRRDITYPCSASATAPLETKEKRMAPCSAILYDYWSICCYFTCKTQTLLVLQTRLKNHLSKERLDTHTSGVEVCSRKQPVGCSMGVCENTLVTLRMKLTVKYVESSVSATSDAILQKEDLRSHTSS